jgi:hypothetical protein
MNDQDSTPPVDAAPAPATTPEPATAVPPVEAPAVPATPLSIDVMYEDRGAKELPGYERGLAPKIEPPPATDASE